MKGFEETAKQISGSYSASDGGRLGWLSEKSLSKKILNKVNKLKINEISDPIISGNSLMLIKLNNVRVKQVENLNTEKLRKNIIKQKKMNYFLYIQIVIFLKSKIIFWWNINE